MPLIGGNPLGTSLGNTSSYSYNKEITTLGKDSSSSLVLKHAFVQEYKYRLVCIKSTLDITRLSIKTHLFFLFFFIYFIFVTLSFFLSISFSSSFFELSVSQIFFFSTHSLFSISFDLHILVLESTVRE